ncbi:LOW QUALITY PROTEIN: transmembrane protease serine 5 [Rhynchonycteris naso]
MAPDGQNIDLTWELLGGMWHLCLVSVSFRMNTEDSLLEVQVSALGWLLVCHEGWSPALGIRVCWSLGHLRTTHHRGVNLTEIQLNGSQEFAQLSARLGLLEDVWQPRDSCTSCQIVSLKCSECGARPLASRTVGEQPVVPGHWLQASVALGSWHTRGGSVLAPHWVVTTVHCVHSVAPVCNFRLSCLSSWWVYVGLVSHSMARPHQGALVKIIPHPRYSPNHDDIALLRLWGRLNFSDTVGAVCLPAEEQDFPRGSQCWVSGWGHSNPSRTHSSDTLQDSVVLLLSTQLCTSSCVCSGALTPRMLCACYLDGRADACQRFGGGAVCPDRGIWYLVGVVSWGRGCAEPKHPGMYAKVVEFLDWIQDTTWVHQMEEKQQIPVQKRTRITDHCTRDSYHPPNPSDKKAGQSWDHGEQTAAGEGEAEQAGQCPAFQHLEAQGRAVRGSAGQRHLELVLEPTTQQTHTEWREES